MMPSGFLPLSIGARFIVLTMRKQDELASRQDSLLDVHFDGAEPEFAGVDGGFERVHDHGIEF